MSIQETQWVDWLMSLMPGLFQSTSSVTVSSLNTVQGGPTLPSHLKSSRAG